GSTPSSASTASTASTASMDPQLRNSPGALRLLGEAYERLGRHRELAAVREREVALLEQQPLRAGDRRELIAAARALAELYEQLDDLDGAARAWHRVDEYDDKDAAAARALQRIYE